MGVGRWVAIGAGILGLIYVLKNFSTGKKEVVGAIGTPPLSPSQISLPSIFPFPIAPAQVQPSPSLSTLMTPSPQIIYKTQTRKTRVQDKTVFTTPQALKKATSGRVTPQAYVKSSKRFSSVASILKKTAGQHGGIRKITPKFKGRASAAQRAANR